MSADEERGDDLALGPPPPPFMKTLLRQGWKVVAASVAVAAMAWGATFTVKPVYTAETSLLPPQQAQSAALSALSSLGSLANLGGGARTPADQLVSILQSVTVSERIVDAFKLMPVYESQFRSDAVRTLGNNVRVSVGKKDGLLRIEVQDTDPKRAADIANRYVTELRRVVDVIAITEAQQRRVFFEEQLKQVRTRLAAAQQDLQASGFSPGSLKAEPKAAADGYARLRAEVTAAEVKLQTLRASLVDQASEVQAQRATVAALRDQLSRQERTAEPEDRGGFIDKYREYKYQESLFDLYAKQYEVARIDESREAALIQVLDPAQPPDRHSRPRRLLTAGLAGLATLLLGLVVAFGPGRLWRLRAPAGPSVPA